MFGIPVLGRDTAFKVWVSMYNADSVEMSVGMGVYDYYGVTDGGETGGTGYSITHSPIASASCANPALLAGVVMNKNIQPGDYGLVQKYGEHDAVRISGGASGHGYVSQVASYTSWTNSKFTNLIMRPCLGAFATESSGAVANAGYFGFIAYNPLQAAISGTASAAIGGYASVTETASNVTVTITHTNTFNYPGGYCVPVGNVAATATYTSSTTIKAFIRCMDN